MLKRVEQLLSDRKRRQKSPGKNALERVIFVNAQTYRVHGRGTKLDINRMSKNQKRSETNRMPIGVR